MNYSEVRTGRVIITRFNDGEDFVSGMDELVRKARLKVRKIAEVFLIVEVVVLEISDTDARRVYDPDSGLTLLNTKP